MQHGKVLGLAVLGLALAACSTWTVKSDYNPVADFGRYRTYSWLEPTEGSEEARYVNTLTEQRVKQQVRRELADKGIVEAKAGQAPDFLITYRVDERERIDVTPWGYGPWPYYAYGYGPGYAYGYPRAYSYTEGTLVLDFVDARSRNVFWRGYASRAIDGPEAESKKVGEAVDRILEKYPPLRYAGTARPRG